VIRHRRILTESDPDAERHPWLRLRLRPVADVFKRRKEVVYGCVRDSLSVRCDCLDDRLRIEEHREQDRKPTTWRTARTVRFRSNSSSYGETKSTSLTSPATNALKSFILTSGDRRAL
jgi:hypothetical protein